MNTLQEAETSLILEYFDVNINKKGTLVTLNLKSQFKQNKLIPIKKIRDNGQKVVETGEKYYQHYLGDSLGKTIYQIRKKLYSMYSLLEWVQTIPISIEDREFIKKRLEQMHCNNSVKLKTHYSSDSGIETKKKLLERSKKWAKSIGKMNSNLWKSEEYKTNQINKRKESGQYEKSRKKMLENYNNPEFKNRMLERANDPKRKKEISNAAKKMWKVAKHENHDLFKKMINLCGGKKNFEIHGIKMNSIEFLVAKVLDELKIHWKYGQILNVGVNTYIPDFILSEKNIIIECNGDYWHATPRLYTENQMLRKGVLVGDVWKKDKKKIDFYSLAGYTCLTYWEYDIINNLNEIKQKIYNEYNKK